MQDNTSERRKSPRKSEAVAAELYLESSVFKAQTIDVSEEGVRLELNKPIRFNIRVRVGDMLVNRLAEIVWFEDPKQAGGFSYGFRYVE